MFKDSTKYRTVHYGHPESVTDAHEHVDVIDSETLVAAYGEYDWRKNLFKHGITDLAHTVFK